jgi:hypothetical protein
MAEKPLEAIQIERTAKLKANRKGCIAFHPHLPCSC